MRLRLKVGQIGHKWDNFGNFSEQISVHFGSLNQNVLKSDLKMSRFVPSRSNQTHFVSKSNTPGVDHPSSPGRYGPELNVQPLFTAAEVPDRL